MESDFVNNDNMSYFSSKRKEVLELIPEDLNYAKVL